MDATHVEDAEWLGQQLPELMAIATFVASVAEDAGPNGTCIACRAKAGSTHAADCAWVKAKQVVRSAARRNAPKP